MLFFMINLILSLFGAMIYFLCTLILQSEFLGWVTQSLVAIS